MKYLPLLLVLIFAFGGCATRDPDRVSTIPWNRPESGEGMGQLGFLNTR